MFIHCENAEDLQYIEYITEHKNNTYKAFLNVKSLLLQDLETFPDISELDNQIQEHDFSKFSKEEWEPYRNYFYPTENNPKDEAAFDMAWLHHQHHNPHHWQHWTLLRDSGETVGLDMPVNYVIEMLCDWHSFSAKDPTSTAYDWWNKNRNKMIMSAATIQLVEKYIEYFKEPLKQRRA